MTRETSHPQIVLVTGASVGFGAAIARRYAALGARVIVAARRIDKLEALATEFGADQVLPVALDVRDRASVERVIANLPAAFADVDCLINNAGLALGLEPAHRTNLDHWEQMIDTNCKGLVCVTRAVLPGMVARNRGHIVNMSSVGRVVPVSRRQRVRRDEGVRAAVQPEPAERPARDGGSRHVHRARFVRWN